MGCVAEGTDGMEHGRHPVVTSMGPAASPVATHKEAGGAHTVAVEEEDSLRTSPCAQGVVVQFARKNADVNGVVQTDGILRVRARLVVLVIVGLT